jgi:hypothetical protein
MTLYENIQQLEPYFHSIRKHQSFFIIDIKIPKDWTFKNIVVREKEVVGFKDNGIKSDFRFLSFYTKQENIDIETSIGIINDVINTNQEREEKERLLQEKIIELKRKFEDGDLDTLKSLHFEVSQETVVSTDEETVNETEDEDGSERVTMAREGAE